MVKGLQISGTAEIGRKGSAMFEEGIKAYKKRKGLKKVLMPDFMNVLKINPIEIDFIDSFSVRSEWGGSLWASDCACRDLC